MKRLITWLGTTSAAIAASLLTVSPALAMTLVNTELVFSVDVSDSIDAMEFELQRQGYANAFRNAELIEQITGLDKGIAVTLQYWSDTTAEALDWFHITDAASAELFAQTIENTDRPTNIGTGTNIAQALYSATDLLEDNDFDGRKLIDLSADGFQSKTLDGISRCDPNDNPLSTHPDCTSLVEAARDYALSRDVMINGLPILNDVVGLESYFEDFVIGGSDAFLQAASDFNTFEQAIVTKIQREIASVPEPSITLGLLALGLLGDSSLIKKQRDRA